MLLRYQLVYDYELYLISILFPAFQYLSSPLSILPYLSEKAQLQPDFFDRLKGGHPPSFFFYPSSASGKRSKVRPLCAPMNAQLPNAGTQFGKEHPRRSR